MKPDSAFFKFEDKTGAPVSWIVPSFHKTVITHNGQGNFFNLKRVIPLLTFFVVEETCTDPDACTEPKVVNADATDQIQPTVVQFTGETKVRKATMIMLGAKYALINLN